MEEVRNLLEARADQLKQLRKEKALSLEKAPEGVLRLSYYDGKTHFYHRKSPGDTTGTYLREKDFPIARQLAQKEYDKRILAAAEQELSVVERYLREYPKTNVEQVYETLHKERQKLVTPVEEPEEQFVRRWQEVAYEGKAFSEGAPQLFTAKDLLSREEIPYRYEYPLKLKGWGTIYPDFTVLNRETRKEIYWEHLGMMDDPDYAENALQKIELYEKNGIFPGEGLILTRETKKNPLNQKMVRLMIEHHLK